MLQKATYFCLFLLLITHVSLFAQNKKGFTIKGNIEGLPDGTIFYLIRNKDNGGADTVAQVKSKNGEFEFKGYVEGGANYYFIKMDTTVFSL